jgi:thiol-disulfide isomerase/thioredoxin
MRRIFVIVNVLVGLLASQPAYPQGVNFRGITLDEALASARAESKLVMVDCQTSWCGPCKYMSGTVFPKAEAGEFFNRHFVCVEFDMEKGEGIEIRNKYKVQAFPTFLILDTDGVERHRVVGSGDLDTFIPRVRRALDRGNTLTVLEKEYASGKMSKARKLAYITTLQDAYAKDKAAAIREELRASLTPAEKLSATFWPLIDDNAGAPSLETLLLVGNNWKTLKKNVGEKKVAAFLEQGCSLLLDRYISRNEASDDGVKLAATTRDYITRGYITAGVPLEVKLKLADAVSANDFLLFVTLVADNAPTLQATDLFSYMFIFGKVDVKDKALVEKVVKIGDLLLEKAPGEEVKTIVEKQFARFHKALATGVYWEKLTLDEALALAGREKKLVFVDCYTTWCGPCKEMADNVFPRADVGEFFNERFINVKIDMEEGDGPAIATRYGVRVFPTFLMLRPDGSVQHRIIGSSTEIITEAANGLDDEKASSALDKKYADGNRDKEFLATYLRMLVDFGDIEKAGEVHEALDPLLTDAERTSEKFWFIYESNAFSGAGSGNFDYLVDHYKAFVVSVGKESVDEKIVATHVMMLYPFLLGEGQGTPDDLARMKKRLAPCKLIGGEELLACVDIIKAYVEGDANKLLKRCEKEFRHLTEERVDIAIFTLTYLKEHATGQTARLKALAGMLAGKVTNDDYKELLNNMFAG